MTRLGASWNGPGEALGSREAWAQASAGAPRGAEWAKAWLMARAGLGQGKKGEANAVAERQE